MKFLTDQIEKYDYHQKKHQMNTDGLERSLMALRDTLETTKPIKSNNWDSVREAFKGPVRNDVNERN
jgi:hypothetical protein